jgi:hypothetical protein
MRRLPLLAPLLSNLLACGGPADDLVEVQSAQSADDGWLRLVRLKLYQDTDGEVVTDHGLSIRAEHSSHGIEVELSAPAVTGTVNLEVRVDCGGLNQFSNSGDFEKVHDKNYSFVAGGKTEHTIQISGLCPDGPGPLPVLHWIDQASIDVYLLQPMTTNEFITPAGTARHLYVTRDSYDDGAFYTDDARLGVVGGRLRIYQTTESDDRREMHLRYYNRTSNQDYEVKLDIRTRCRRPSTGATATVDAAARTVWVDAGEDAEVTVLCPVDYRVDYTETWFQAF